MGQNPAAILDGNLKLISLQEDPVLAPSDWFDGEFTSSAEFEDDFSLVGFEVDLRLALGHKASRGWYHNSPIRRNRETGPLPVSAWPALALTSAAAAFWTRATPGAKRRRSTSI